MRWKQQGYTVERRRIQLDEPLKTVGEFHVPIRLFREVTAHVQVNVKSDQPEAPPEAGTRQKRNALQQQSGAPPLGRRSSFPEQNLEVKAVADLAVDLAWVVLVEASKGEAVIEQHAAVRYVAGVHGDGDVFSKGSGEPEIKGSVRRQVVAAVG